MDDIKKYLAEIGRRGGLKGGKARREHDAETAIGGSEEGGPGAMEQREEEEGRRQVKVAIYARVSTTDQHNEIQVRELTEYVARRGWELAGTYTDQMSGAKAKRPGLDALMHDARLHEFDAVLVWKLDRFGVR